MSEADARIIDLSVWVSAARTDPMKYLERQATEVVLATTASLGGNVARLVLKGGMLMATVHGSPRTTADIDFSSRTGADGRSANDLHQAISAGLPRSAARLGYADLRMQVQSVHERPRPFGATLPSFPAIEVTIGYAERDTPAATRLDRGMSPHVVRMEISFNETMCEIEVVRLGPDGPLLAIYSENELIAEKLRALLQQIVRQQPRFRRQDVFDIAFLLDKRPPDGRGKKIVLETFLVKSHARGISPDIATFNDPRIAEHARRDWASIQQEISIPLPPFDEVFDRIVSFYRSLPWTS